MQPVFNLGIKKHMPHKVMLKFFQKYIADV